jgi:hypothetical protein
MTTRERKLATILIGILLVVGGFLLANVAFLKPLSELSKESKGLEAESKKRQKEIDDEKKYVEAVAKLSPRLGQWRKLSLPRKNDPKPDATPKEVREAEEETRLYPTRIRDEYQKVIEKLLKDCKFTTRAFKGTEPDSRAANLANRTKPVYQAFTYSYEGEAEVSGIISFFEGFYRIPLLHQIKAFSLTTMRTSKALDVKMTIEVLRVDSKDVEQMKQRETIEEVVEVDGKREKTKRQGIRPVFSTKEVEPVMMATSKRNYKQVATVRNPFAPYIARRSDEDLGPDTSVLDRLLPGIELNFIGTNTYYGTWVALLRNQWNKDDCTVLVDGPLPKDSPYQKDRKEAQRKRDPMPKEPVTKWVLRDGKTGETQMEMEVMLIEPLRVIVKYNSEVYALRIGCYLNEALASPLKPDEIKKLGLAGNRDDTLKGVVLKTLEFSKDRKTYEALFVNPAYKDKEKPLLSTEPRPEDFEAPDTWSIRDSVSNEVLKITLVKMEKDRVVFKAEDKYYSIKLGGNLLDALKKPLTEAEAKELKLP